VETNTLSVPHAIVFLFDPGVRDLEFPDIAPASPVSSNNACVSVNVRPAVDGEVQISIARSGEFDRCGAVVFEGPLATPSGCVGVFTSGNEQIVLHRHNRSTANLVIRVDDPGEAARVWVEVM
jgi:hypothetical protein